MHIVPLIEKHLNRCKDTKKSAYRQIFTDYMQTIIVKKCLMAFYFGCRSAYSRTTFSIKGHAFRGDLRVVRVSPLADASISFRPCRRLLSPYRRHLRRSWKLSPSPVEGIPMPRSLYRVQRYDIPETRIPFTSVCSTFFLLFPVISSFV